MNNSPSETRAPRFAVALTAAVILVLLFLYQVVETLALVVIAILFATYLSGLTDFFERRARLDRRVGLMLSILVTAGGLAAIGYLILPAVVQQVRDLTSTLPTTEAGWTTY